MSEIELRRATPENSAAIRQDMAEEEVHISRGAYNGKCNIMRCITVLPANWYNASTHAYYCLNCADYINSFDHVICSFCDHDLSFEEKDNLNRELYKRLKP